ncbi:cytochrome P450 [Amycolatopsis oliviviridis]|uniref:Cytochrome P450 n=1 Tax=Amycolatopsis oliviviridis TaxID=1471590 RepID=A0ABQ3M7V6_9PSEU|nr:cytochrome P450 [Amycolatopsis oliviviridis]GHH34641.1 cytochrome P450 [Amycolatopsis oliviviridis]
MLENLLTPETRTDPYPFYRQVFDRGPVFEAADRFFVVSGFEEASALLKNPAFGHSEPEVLPDPHENEPVDDQGRVVRSFLGLDPPDHTRLRRLVSKAFTPRMVEQLAPRVEELAKELVFKAVERGEFDLMTEVAKPLPVVVISELLGVPLADRDRFERWSDAMGRALDPAFLIAPETVEAAVAARREFVGYFRELAAERRKRPTGDLFSDLVSVSDEGDRLSEGELVATAMLLLVAGHETTTNLIGNGVLALLDNPEQHRKLAEDRSKIPNAVEEMLRFDSPVQLTMRIALRDTTIGGLPVGEGAQAVLLLGAANRDPRAYERPDRFDVDRPSPRHLALGQGIHFCLGAPLARLEGRTLFDTLLGTGRAFRRTADPVWVKQVTLRGMESLRLEFA